ncbi:unnamed protein product, partial [Dovyalis caffra]
QKLKKKIVKAMETRLVQITDSKSWEKVKCKNTEKDPFKEQFKPMTLDPASYFLLAYIIEPLREMD